MSIKDIGKKIKSFWLNRFISTLEEIKNNFKLGEDLFVILTIILIGFAGFGLGKLSALEKNRGVINITPAKIITTGNGDIDLTPVLNTSDIKLEIGVQNMSAAAMISSETAKGMLVASKSGKKYHFPWCAGASQIADKNKIWFDSYEEAQKAGYTPAVNCKDLK
jgi:hypothetical protein